MEDVWVALVDGSREARGKGNSEATDNSTGIDGRAGEKRQMENSRGGGFKKDVGMF